MRLRAIFSFIFIGSLAMAQATDQREDYNIYRRVIERALDRASNIGSPCFACELSEATGSAGEVTPTPCRSTYESLYREDTVEMRFVLGYADGDSFIHDRYQKYVIAEQLTSDCGIRKGACGFKPLSDDDDEVFVKTLIGPDGKEKTVRIRLVSSSESVIDKENRLTSSPGKTVKMTSAQETRSRYAEKIFLDGMKEAEVVIYVGHARKGGGPSFEPAVLNAAGKVDYNYYKFHQDSAERMFAAIESSSRPPKLLGVFACDASPLWAEQFREKAPQTGVVLAGSIVRFDAAIAQAYATLDSVLAMRCESDFQSSIRAIDKIDGSVIQPPVIDNFFKFRLF